MRGYLAKHRRAPESLTLEITESSLFVDAPRTRATIDDLHDVGMRLAIDDFGTGYSSLSYLRRLPVHELKVDQTFVAGMLADPQDEVIVRSTIDLGHNLGLKVVAEGVESVPDAGATRRVRVRRGPGIRHLAADVGRRTDRLGDDTSSRIATSQLGAATFADGLGRQHACSLADRSTRHVDQGFAA